MLRELIVPSVMMIATGAYLVDALHLSLEALLLPTALIGAIGFALAWAIADAFLRSRRGGVVAPRSERGVEGSVLEHRPWLLLAIPLVLMATMDWTGALIALTMLVILSQLTFGQGSPLGSVLVAVLVTVPTYALFKYVLYVRFPSGVFGIG
jgi:hypothetical protein